MADGKWIEGLTPDMAVDEAAAVVLAARFEVVRYYLPLAADKPFDDPGVRPSTSRRHAPCNGGAACLRRLLATQAPAFHQTRSSCDSPLRERCPRLGRVSSRTRIVPRASRREQSTGATS